MQRTAFPTFLAVVAGILLTLAPAPGLTQGTWQNLGFNGPSGRSHHGMAYDSTRDRIVVFGGDSASGVLGDTWEFDGTNWTQRSSTGPSARRTVGLAYDSVRQVTVLFGGRDASNTALGDTWEWNGNTWTLRSNTGPSARSGVLAFNPSTSQTFLCAGSSSFSDTWAWDGTTWSPLPGGGISARFYNRLAFNTVTQRMMMFGGDLPPNRLQDLYEWNGNLWSLLVASGPGARAGAGMTFDASRGRLVVFGGYDQNFASLGDTWEWNGSVWAQTSTSGVSARAGAGMVYDSMRQRIVLMGGGNLSGTYAYTNPISTPTPTATAPPTSTPTSTPTPSPVVTCDPSGLLAFVPQPTFLGSGNAFFSQVGTSVAVDGTVAAVGARGDNTGASSAGAVYVLAQNNGVWSESARLVANNGLYYDWMGDSVAIHGDTLVAGAPQLYANPVGAGAAFVFTQDVGVQTWSNTQKLTPGNGVQGDRFGEAVAYDGTRIAVGAPGAEATSTNSGAVYVFEQQGGNWVQQPRIFPTDGTSGAEFGNEVLISGNTLFAAAHFDTQFGVLYGSVYVFQWNGNTWVQVQKLQAPDNNAGAQFGQSLALSGNWLLVGASASDEGANLTGAVYAYKNVGETWTYQQKIVQPNASERDFFGWSIALDGATAAIGAIQASAPVNPIGKVYIYTERGGTWGYNQTVTALDPASNDEFGSAVALTGRDLLVGVPSKSSPNVGGGAVYPFLSSCLPAVATPTPLVTDTPASTATPTPTPTFVDPCLFAIPVSCEAQVNGDTTTGTLSINGYTCISWDESGPEQIYEVTVQADHTLTVSITILTAGQDLDLFLLDGCTAPNCLAYGDNTFSRGGLPQGTYYIAVDGYQGDFGMYSLQVSCQPNTPTPAPTETPTSTPTATDTQVPTATATPFPCLRTVNRTLITGWNQLGFAEVPQGMAKASEVMDSVAGQGITVTHLAQWNGSSWQIFQVGLPLNNFTLKQDFGYLLRVTQGGTWTYFLNRCP